MHQVFIYYFFFLHFSCLQGSDRKHDTCTLHGSLLGDWCLCWSCKEMMIFGGSVVGVSSFFDRPMACRWGQKSGRETGGGEIFWFLNIEETKKKGNIYNFTFHWTSEDTRMRISFNINNISLWIQCFVSGRMIGHPPTFSIHFWNLMIVGIRILAIQDCCTRFHNEGDEEQTGNWNS